MALALSSTEIRVAAIASTDQIRMTGDGANLWRVERRGTAMNLVWYQNNIFRSSRPLTGITITASDRIVSVCNENASNLLVAIYFTTGTPRSEIWRVPKGTTGTVVATRLSTEINCSRRTEMGTDFDGNKWVGNHRGIIKRVDNPTSSAPTACDFNNTIGGNIFSATALPVGAAEVVDGSDDKMLVLRQDGNLYEVTPNTTTSGTTITATLVGNIGTGTPEGLAATNVSSTSKNLYYTRGNVLYRRVLNHAAEVTTPAAATGSWTVNAQTVSLAATGAGTHQLPAATGGTGAITYSLRTTGTGLSMTGRTINIPASYTAQARRLTVRATWTSGSSTAFLDRSFDFTVNRAPAVAQAGSFTAGSSTLRLNTGAGGSANIGAASGGTGTISYALRTVQAGVFLSGRTLGVAGTVPAGTYSLTIRATWTSGTSTAFRDSVYSLTVVRLVITQRGTFSVSAKSLSLYTGTGGSFPIEAATGGAGTLTYSLVSPPAGFSISGQTISVASTVAAGTHNLRVRATWRGDVGAAQSRDATFTFTLSRQAVPTEQPGGGGGMPWWMIVVARRRRKAALKRRK